MKPGGTLFISSLCSSDDQNHTLYNGEVPYRFIPTPEHLLHELKDSGFSILDWKVARRREFSHMEAFARIR
ncbi:MAG: hypothetical protein CVV64_17685 [Candidatus Wallbacteria bacterium HGW-Wallbacteria-1]|jgi:hypothetical protein|uniref:Uncharacterized protein n=1 Tax=Candidatus Wallbacteria bacterium HGW-Wallbacteria-1 TaxID=2013854 RepID=A0A2N1PK11_9BACT|nr:MAG: hypothetical protein CVV64_17685 [Candidatus Wallbacteria bacterium HGW-Wallbacteria-1]